MKNSDYVSDFSVDITQYKKNVNFGSLIQVRKVNRQIVRYKGMFYSKIVRLIYNEKFVGYGILAGVNNKLISVDDIDKLFQK